MKQVAKRRVRLIRKKAATGGKGKGRMKLKRTRARWKGKRLFTSRAVNRMLDRSHTQGYQSGYRDGLAEGQKGTEAYERGHEHGYRKGLYDGGEAYVDTTLPFDVIMPDISIQQIVEAGVQQFQSHYVALQNAAHIADRLHAALDGRTPFSLVRLGDGEVLTMAQESALSIEQVKKEGHFLSYAGVDVPDLAARDQLVASVRQATVVGIPKLRNFTYQPLAIQALRAHGIDYRSLSLTHSLINYYIYKEGRLGPLLRGRSVLVIGNVAPGLGDVLKEHGILVSGVISPVNGVHDAGRVLAEAAHVSFDIALVASGIAAVTIAQRIATELGKVAIDFGHLADALANRHEPFY